MISRVSPFLGVAVFLGVAATTFAACGGSARDDVGAGDDSGILRDEAGNPIVDPGIDGGLPPGETRDPADCNEAKNTRSYVGCDYWPTVNANNVWSIFDFAAVVANTGATAADVR